jgi:hypothetical protein
MLLRFLAPAAAAAAVAACALTALVLTGCPTNQSAVCQSIGDCSQGGSSDWVNACQNEANLLQTEAQTDGCGTEYDDYYSCAESNFTCTGTTASFPGCEVKLSSLDSCINTAEAQTSCAALTAAEATCGAPPPDAGAQVTPVGETSDAGDAGIAGDAGSDAGTFGDAGAADAAPPPVTALDAGADGGPEVPIACTAQRDCEARCYLDIVADVCAPQVNELDEFSTCASACPP